MFGIHIITDVIKIPASDLHYQNIITTVAAATADVFAASNHTMNGKETTAVRRKTITKKSLLPIIHREIDILYPNRVLIDVGLVISRYYCHPTSITNTHALPHQIKSTSPSDNTSASKKHKRQLKVSSKAPRKKNKQELLHTGTKLLQNGGTCDNFGSSSGGCGVHYKVQFPVIVFRPYVGEILYGTICDMNQNGIIVTLKFFSAIYVPIIYMLQPSTYIPSSPEGGTATKSYNGSSNSGANGIWVWTPTFVDDEGENDDEGSDNEPLRYEMNIGDEIRVRVKSIHYTKPESATVLTSKNGKPSQTDGGGNTPNATINPTKRPRSTSATSSDLTPFPHHKPLAHCAMYVIASICEDGLGLTSWWKSEADGEDDDNEGE
jgi:RNA polymerase III subunit Rpc25